MTLTRRELIAGCLLAGTAIAAAARVRHRETMAQAAPMAVTGTVAEAALGNARGLIRLDADGIRWNVALGRNWRAPKIGLSDAMLAPGKRLTVLAPRPTAPEARDLVAMAVIADGVTHHLVPDRS